MMDSVDRLRTRIDLLKQHLIGAKVPEERLSLQKQLENAEALLTRSVHQMGLAEKEETQLLVGELIQE